MSKLKYYDGTNWKIVNGQVTGDTLPIGAIVPFGGWDAPTGWLICDGTLLNKTDYPELFNAIGYSFGGEEGGNTFGLPDFRGRFPLGLKETDTDFNGMGLTGGSKTHTQTADEVGPHTHQLWVESDQSGSAFGLPQSAMYWDKAKNTWANAQFGVNRTNVNTAQPMDIMNPYQTVNYIIKATQSAGLVANVSKTYSTSEEDTYGCDYENKHFGGVELYEDSTGSAGEITLSDSIDNYSRIKIFYTSTVEDSYEFKPKSGETSKIALGTKYKTGSLFIQTIGTYNCSTNKLTPQLAECGYSTVSSSGSTITWDNTNYCNIKSVIGYK